MNLKDYRETPDEGLFEKIERRLAVRRAARIGGTVLAGVAVAVVAFAVVSVLALQDKREGDQQQLAAVVSQEPVVVAENNVAPATEVVADNAQEQPVRTIELMPIDTTSDVAEATMQEERTPDCWLSTVELEEMIRQVENTLPKEKPQPAVAAAPEAKPAEVVEPTPEVQPTENIKSGQPTPHYDNIIWAPNIIVPGGDVEENRTFSIKATSELKNFNLQIFNRGGHRIYNTADPAFRWNGTYNGSPVPQGAYVWVATFRDTDGNPRVEKGSVVVVR